MARAAAALTCACPATGHETRMAGAGDGRALLEAPRMPPSPLAPLQAQPKKKSTNSVCACQVTTANSTGAGGATVAGIRWALPMHVAKRVKLIPREAGDPISSKCKSRPCKPLRLWMS